MFLPKHYGVTQHAEWRDGQLEAVQWMLSPERKTVSMVQAPTGSGKSGLGTALSVNGKTVRSLTATRALQKQYAKGYNYEELFGMNAYPCALLESGLGFNSESFTAEHCLYPTNMHKCPQAANCEYLQRKLLTQRAQRQALSYAYYFTSDWAKTGADFLYADECHNLPNLLMQYYTLEIDEYVAVKSLGIPKWADQLTGMHKWGVGKRMVSDFLWTGIQELTSQLNSLPTDPRKMSPSMALHISTVKSWRDNMQRTAEGIGKQYPYYIEMIPSADRGDKMDRGDLLVVSPLSARDLFTPMFLMSNTKDDPTNGRAVLTSATIGDSETFGQLLGLEPNDFDFYSVPSRFKPEDMPVYVPIDAPYINFNSSEDDLNKQAEIIKNLIDSMGKTATGLVHFASKRATYDMADRLARIGFQDRIYVTPENGGTEERVDRFKAWQDCNPGTVHLTWCMWEGYDGFDDQFSIVAKAPYATLNPLTKAQMKFDGGNLYRWQTAISIEQGIGRVRRGDESHYGPNANKMTAIVDRNAMKLKGYYSEHFQQCLVEDA